MNPLALIRRARQPVMYEVRLEVDPAIISDFDDWLLLHVREMLALPGFQAATVYRGRDLAESGRALRLVAYEVRGQRELKSYQHTYAPRMQKDGVTRFGKQFAASRRTLPAADYVLPEGFAMLFDRNAISGGLPVCSNCMEPVAGRFCSNCGQEDRTVMLSLGELLYDVIGDMFNFDSRLFRTLRPLLFRPGWLTAEFVRGRRQRYLPPVRMYIFISLVFFFVATLMADGEFGSAGEDAAWAGNAEELTPEQRADAERGLQEAEKELGLPAGMLQSTLPGKKEASAATDEEAPAEDSGDANDRDDNVNISLGGFGSADLEERLERGALAVKEDPQAFAEAVLQQIPTAMFVFLPLLALALKLFYIGSGRYYVEHLIFALHFHSAVFVLLLAWLLFGELVVVWPLLDPLTGWVAAALWLYLPYYLYKSMRCVYGQGRFVTILKFTLLSFAYFIAIVMMFAMTLLYTLYLQA